MIREWLIDRQGQVGVKLSEKEPRAGRAIEQVGVFADPAESGLLRNRLFHHRCGVDKSTIAERPGLLHDQVGEPLQASAQQLVIVAAERVA